MNDEVSAAQVSIDRVIVATALPKAAVVLEEPIARPAGLPGPNPVRARARLSALAKAHAAPDVDLFAAFVRTFPFVAGAADLLAGSIPMSQTTHHPLPMDDQAPRFAVLTEGGRTALCRGTSTEQMNESDEGLPTRAVDRNRPPSDAVAVMTMHRAKGMEFERVILTDVGWRSGAETARLERMPEAERHDAKLRQRSLVYVAATRARDELAVVERRQPPEGRSRL